ncbi:MAG: methylmalonyl-CoA mutase [Phycisphaerae bacterium]
MLPRTLDLQDAFTAPEPDQWRALVEADLKGAPFERRLVTHTYEGIHVRPLYTRADWDRDGGSSGVGSLTRAARPLGNVGRGWDIRQEYSDAAPDASAESIRDDLDGGVRSVVLRLDACARSGLDPRNPTGANLAGRDGIAAYTSDDLDHVLEHCDLGATPVFLECGSAFVEGAALLGDVWRRRGLQDRGVRGGFQADPLAVLARDGSLPYSTAEGLDRLGRLCAWSVERYPLVQSLRVGTAAYHHAGATATQDLAFSMATAVEYLRATERHGLAIDAAAPQLLFSYAVGCHMFLAIAKLRAARRLWARVVEACGGSEDSRRMSMYVRPSKRVLTTRDQWINMLRSTACVLAAGIAGADVIACTPFDSPGGDASPLARRLARNTHHLLLGECHLARVCDPAGGSWYIESLTDELCDRAWVIFQAIERRGGMSRSLGDGWIQAQIDSAVQPRLRNLATRKDVIVGVSEFPDPGEHRRQARPVDRAAITSDACRRLASRPRTPRLPSSAGDAGQVDFATLLNAAAEGASVAELSILLGSSRTEPTQLPSAIHVHPFAEPFEHLRDAADEFAEHHGHRPRVFLTGIGPLAARLARINFCRDLFEAGGFEVIDSPDSDGTIDAVRTEFEKRPAPIVVICGPDDACDAAVPNLGPMLRSAGARRIILAGNPGAREPSLRKAGVDLFVYIKCDMVSLLGSLLAEEGVHL